MLSSLSAFVMPFWLLTSNHVVSLCLVCQRMGWACFYGAPTVPTSIKITKDQGVYVLFRSSELTLKPVRVTSQVGPQQQEFTAPIHVPYHGHPPSLPYPRPLSWPPIFSSLPRLPWPPALFLPSHLFSALPSILSPLFHATPSRFATTPLLCPTSRG